MLMENGSLLATFTHSQPFIQWWQGLHTAWSICCSSFELPPGVSVSEWCVCLWTGDLWAEIGTSKPMGQKYKADKYGRHSHRGSLGLVSCPRILGHRLQGLELIHPLISGWPPFPRASAGLGYFSCLSIHNYSHLTTWLCSLLWTFKSRVSTGFYQVIKVDKSNFGKINALRKS